MSDRPETYPTTSDISQLMRELDFQWSNEAQLYYRESSMSYEYLSKATAEIIYKKFIGDKPFEALHNPN